MDHNNGIDYDEARDSDLGVLSDSESGDDDEFNAAVERIQLQDNANFTPRAYQTELFEIARKKNSIMVLGTGSGKTYISILLIKEFADQIRGSIKDGSKRTVFCVNTVTLVDQQGKAIKKQTPYKVRKYKGSMGVDFWNDAQWEKELEGHEVLVLTAQILLELILHARLPLSKVNLLIMDECHHAVGNHPMREIMREYESLKRSSPDDCPRIMGLTASVINRKCKSHEVMKSMHDLEMTMGSALVTSKYQEEVKNFTTRPREIIVMYRNSAPSSYQDRVTAQLIGMQNDIEEREDIDKKTKKFVGKRIQNISHIMSSLGDWCVARAVYFEMENLEDSAEAEEVLIVRVLFQELRARFQTIHSVCQEEEASMGNPKDHVSHRVKRFIDILSGFPENVLGLIFVERRNTAKIMYDLLLELARQNNDMTYVKPLYVVGANSKPSTDLRLAELELRKQKETLKKFKHGHANFIVSTSVLEEGVDLKKCNVVIRFDKPMNYRAYVQSRGRARAVPSRYILMVEESDHQKFISELDANRELEKSLIALCHDRDLPTKEETRLYFNEDEFIPPYEPFGPLGAKVTTNSAVSLINHYIGKLPQDKFTELTPQFVYFKNERLQVRAGILLPVSSVLRSTVYGAFMDNRHLAKRSAALELCKTLHEMGELDNYIRPLVPKTENLAEGLIDDDLDKQKDEHPRLGTKKHRQIYEREICESFTDNDDEGYQLYSIDIQPTGPDLRKFVVDSSSSTLNLGFICKDKLIHCPFSLFGAKFGEVIINIRHVRKINNISEEMMNKVANFHRQTMELIYRINTSLMEFNPKDLGHCIYVVPLQGDSLCSGLLDDMMKKEYEPRKSFSSGNNRGYFEFERSVYQEAVIFPLYGDEDHVLYYVTDVLDHMNPRSAFPESKMKYENYEGYFKSRYGITITTSQQPLLAAKHIPKELNYLKKMDHKQKSDREPPNFIPELCGVLPFKLSFWWQLSCIPSILHRLNSFGIAYSLSLNTCVYPVPVMNYIEALAFDFKWAGKMAQQTAGNTNLAVGLARKDMEYIHPYMLVHALTLLGSNDSYNLERLEVLGDSFLKFVVGDYLFLKFPDDHEGKLSPRRTYLVCNKTLYKFGKKMMIPNKLQAVNLSPKVNGFIPGFQVKKNVEEELLRMDIPNDKWYKLHAPSDPQSLAEEVAKLKVEDEKPTDSNDQSKMPLKKALCYNPWKQHEVSDKSVADSVEALIGAYLLKCGSRAAKDFLHWLGIGVYKGRSYLNEDLPIPSAILKQESWSLKEINSLYWKACLDRLENTIQYRFNDRSFIVQAVTHPSYSPNRITNTYQRLEFIGDAVLDYYVTCMIYGRHSTCTPGQMTDLRSYFVNNETLARVAVHFELQKHLLHMAPKLHATIKKFLRLCNDDSLRNKLITEDDEDNIEEIQVPKCLGDLIEAIIGAVYMDSGRNIEETSRVVETLMGDVFAKDYDSIEKNCVRQLYEKFPDVEFVKVPFVKDSKATYIVKIKGVLEISCEGKNFQVAKGNAAKKALLKLQDMNGQATAP